MLTLHRLLTTARRFVDGVCAIPRFASMERLEEIREAYRKATQIRSELGIDETGLIQQLAAEREAHNGTRAHFIDQMRVALSAVGMPEDSIQRWIDNEQIESDCLTSRDHDIIDEINKCQAAERELSAARADLEALRVESINVAWTQARSAWEEGYLIGLQSHEGRSTPGGQPYEAPANPYDLVKPESLAAWKAREGGGDGK
jgi:hypothetical protein